MGWLRGTSRPLFGTNRSSPGELFERASAVRFGGVGILKYLATLN